MVNVGKDRYKNGSRNSNPNPWRNNPKRGRDSVNQPNNDNVKSREELDREFKEEIRRRLEKLRIVPEDEDDVGEGK